MVCAAGGAAEVAGLHQADQQLQVLQAQAAGPVHRKPSSNTYRSMSKYHYSVMPSPRIMTTRPRRPPPPPAGDSSVCITTIPPRSAPTSIDASASSTSPALGSPAQPGPGATRRRLPGGAVALSRTAPVPARGRRPDQRRGSGAPRAGAGEPGPSRPVGDHPEPLRRPATDPAGRDRPSHRHTQSALRFVVEGYGAYTSVDGERTRMEPGDFIITPS